jgi:glycosyltransferase involved in cell wall biosynthesis
VLATIAYDIWWPMVSAQPRNGILYCTRHFYLDDSNGAAVASRAAIASLARNGLDVEVLCGSIVDAGAGDEPTQHLATLGVPYEVGGGVSCLIEPAGLRLPEPAHLRTTIDGVPVTVLDRPLRRFTPPDADEAAELRHLLAAICSRFRPDVLLTCGGDPLTLGLLASARRRGIATAFALHDMLYDTPVTFRDVDAVIAPSRFAAEHYRRTLGLRCIVLPNMVDLGQVRGPRPEPRFVAFVNPCADKGLFAFARIADELGRRRPDIPLLVVEGRGTAADLATCGLDLERHGNVRVMPRTPDPRQFWGITHVALVPSVVAETQSLVAVEAMANGIPVVASDRGALPETLGAAGVRLTLPEHLTPASRHLPTAEEVAPWVEAIIRLWDDAALYAEQRRLGAAEARRFLPETLAPHYVRFFNELRPRPACGATRTTGPPAGQGGHARTPAAVPDPPPPVGQPAGPDQGSGARISIIVPVYNGATTLDRAIESVLAQTHSRWELLAVDDGSADDSHAQLLDWARRDGRIRVRRLSENRGPSAARNEGLRHATGDLVAYLDRDDEYDPGYLAGLARHAGRADVLVSGYDLVRDDDPAAPPKPWDPSRHRDRLFAVNIVTPLGVAHRRDLIARVGGFDERLRFEEDWDLWKRLARGGARFLFLPTKSGRYHIRPDSLSRAGRTTPPPDQA